ncbi:MAG: hypothetical protein HP044_01850, partial [Oscillospiraceae bacterium]|nr:hypothetical protein [Oscillospiraceae bacterium]
DIVVLNKYLISNTMYSLQNATAKENSNTVYDEILDTKDSIAIINYVLQLNTLDDLGPADKPDNEFYSKK